MCYTETEERVRTGRKEERGSWRLLHHPDETDDQVADGVAAEDGKPNSHTGADTCSFGRTRSRFTVEGSPYLG